MSTTRTVRLAAGAVLVVVLVALSACATEPGSHDGSAPATSAEPASTPTADVAATEVRYVRSGGLRGEVTSYTFAAEGAPPPGFTRKQQQRVLSAAAAPELRALTPGAPPKTLCCDRFSYEVTVTWSDGQRRTFRSTEGVDAAPALAALLRVAG